MIWQHVIATALVQVINLNDLSFYVYVLFCLFLPIKLQYLMPIYKVGSGPTLLGFNINLH